jgi:putative ABC transport system permease protein
MPSIARKNLFEDIPRFLVAQAGIAFAVSLVTIQTGIFRGFLESASILVERSRADLWITSKDFVHLELTLPIPLELVVQSREVAGVSRAEGLLLRKVLWRDRDGQIDTVSMVGFDPGGRLFRPWNLIGGDLDSLRQPYRAAVDRTKLRSLGLRQGLGELGRVSELPMEVSALTQGAQSILFSPFLFTSLSTAGAYLRAGQQSELDCQVSADGGLDCLAQSQGTGEPAQGDRPTTEPLRPDDAPVPRRAALADPISFVLVEVAPEADRETVRQALANALPNTRVFTREELIDRAQVHWRDRTGVGFVLALGAGVGLIVGVAIVGQILYSSASDRIREFGTLKAMGASNFTLRLIIIEQALWMAALGYIPGMGLCLGVAAWAAAEAGVTIAITPLSALGIFGVTVMMCTGSALFAIQKIERVDPAIVFKA